MLYIVPSRGRPHNIVSLISAWESTRSSARLFVAVDDDDPELDAYANVLRGAPEWVLWSKSPRAGMVGSLNRFARIYAQDDDIIGFMGDDHAPRTWAWDQMISDALKHQSGIVYGNDLLQGANLPTAVAMSAVYIRTLGRMAPLTLHHLYVDNYWKSLGEKLGRLTYLPNCIIEHMHPIAGKSSWDERYEAVNAGEVYERDQRAYAKFVADGNLDRDVFSLRGL